MLRISEGATTPAETRLRLDGEVTGRWVDELRRECARALGGGAGAGSQLVLDIAEVSSVDSAGVALFRELTTRGVTVTNCSPYVAELLKRVVSADK
jgi:ABC-type transporter Mla MlaB component